MSDDDPVIDTRTRGTACLCKGCEIRVTGVGEGESLPLGDSVQQLKIAQSLEGYLLRYEFPKDDGKGVDICCWAVGLTIQYLGCQPGVPVKRHVMSGALSCQASWREQSTSSRCPSLS